MPGYTLDPSTRPVVVCAETETVVDTWPVSERNAEFPSFVL